MKDYILELTKDLIRIPSVSSDSEQLQIAVDRIEQEFTNESGIIVEKHLHNQKPSIIIKNFDGKRADVCLNGHVDVVPALEGQFEPVEKDGRLYGRGAADMKTNAAIGIAVMKQIKSLGIDKKVSLVLTTDEEIGGENGMQYLASEGYGGDFFLTLDASNHRKLVIGEKGLYHIEIETKGTAGHSAYPWRSDNAIEKMIRMYEEFKQAIEETDELSKEKHRGTSVQMTVINSGKAHNAIPSSARCTLSIRHTESFSETLLKNMCKHIATKYDGEIKEIHYAPLFIGDVDEPVIQSYMTCMSEVTGETVSHDYAHGATDARYFADKDCIICVHGATGGNLHAPDERVDISSIQEVYDTIILYLEGVK